MMMDDKRWNEDQVNEALGSLEGSSAAEIVGWGLDAFGPDAVIASSFSKEDVALVDLASKSGRPFRVIALDTGRLHEETYWLADQLQERYELYIEWQVPHGNDLEAMVREKGMYAFRRSLEDRKACCDIRKVRPLRRALSRTPAWMTGLRRDQGVTRSVLPPIEWDSFFGGLVKLNPLYAWSDDELDAYVRDERLPTNVLYDQGYPSIGCAPCSRPVAEGAHPRSGRWWWEDPDNAECGLHPVSHLDGSPSAGGAR